MKRFPKDGDGFRSFWRIFAAKEAAWKALVQAGVRVPDGAYRLLEFDAELNEIVCLPTGDRVRAEFAEDDSDKLHCVASLAAAPAVVRRGVARLAAGADPSTSARESLIESLARERGLDAASLAVGEREGFPRILERGRWKDWSVSLSHAGRFVAFSYIAD